MFDFWSVILAIWVQIGYLKSPLHKRFISLRRRKIPYENHVPSEYEEATLVKDDADKRNKTKRIKLTVVYQQRTCIIIIQPFTTTLLATNFKQSTPIPPFHSHLPH